MTQTSNNKCALPPYANGKVPLDINNFLNNEINANAAEAVFTRRRQLPPNVGPLVTDPSPTPPPLPPRTPHSAPLLDSSDAVNSINKQMSYPLVATCATLVNDYVSNTCEWFLILTIYLEFSLVFGISVTIFLFVFYSFCMD